MWNLRLKRSKETGGGKEGDELDPLSLFLSLLPRRSNLPVDETRQAQPEYQEREARRDFHVEPLDCSLREGNEIRGHAGGLRLSLETQLPSVSSDPQQPPSPLLLFYFKLEYLHPH